MRWWPCLVVVFACGDNVIAPDGPALLQTDVIAIVAHQDDDLLFMASDLAPRLASRRGITTVYVTAGDAGAGVATEESRLAAVRAAYGIAAGSQAWECGWLDIDGHAVSDCRLVDRDVSIVEIGVPDGFPDGSTPGSLLHLFEAKVDHTDTVATHGTTYTRDELVDTLAAVIDSTHAHEIWTLDIANTYGGDHSDHGMVGTLAVLARARAATKPALISYRGYNINSEPPMLSGALADAVSLPMRSYEACAIGGCGTCGIDSCPTLTDPRYAQFVLRHYAAPARAVRSGWLRDAAGCVTVSAPGDVSVGACTDSAELRFTPDGRITSGDLCLEVDAAGAITATASCTPAASRTFLVDGEGHVWTGLAADSTQLTSEMHALCLGVDEGKLTAQPCGLVAAPSWRIERPPARTDRATLGMSATGRALQLADVTGDGRADLCGLTRAGLACAVGDGAGHFSPFRRVATPPMLADVDLQSLALGDIDGDHGIDACGADANGTWCALSSMHYARSVQLALPGACSPGTLSIADDTACALDASGLRCTRHGATTAPIVSTWPIGHPAWAADLDGDGDADWCAETPAGPACGLAADRALTADGISWGFSVAGAVEGSTAVDGVVSDSLRALGDVTGDGHADLCTVIANRVECAPAVGRSFGPRATMLELDPTATPRALWLGDLDGDGVLDACVDTSDAIVCAISP